tara:strand:+ start:223 stop:543 length:321 start_codon:yes stop_codon:yes gene_type:complete
MFQNPFSAEGRIGRLEYFISHVLVQIGSYGLGYLLGYIGLTDGMTYGLAWLYIPSIFIWIWLLMQGAKRCHDRGNSGWYQIIPFYGLWMIFAPGDEGDNAYGPSPN